MTGLKILGAIVALGIVSAAAVGSLMYFRVIPIPGPLLAWLAGAREPEYSARYYPPDTMAYAWITLVPGDGQFQDMQEIWDRFNEFRDFRRFVDELKDEFSAETGIDFEQDIEPWIGLEVSVGFIDYSFRRDEAIIAATLDVRNKRAAEEFLRKWLKYMEVSEGADFASGSYQGFNTWADDDEYQHYALSNDLLVYATTDGGLQEVIDLITGDAVRSLADNENFIQARASLPQRRFATAYVDFREGLDLMEDLYSDELSGMGSSTLVGQEPEWIAASATWLDTAISVETVMPIGIDQSLQIANLGDPGRLVPGDTLGYLALTFDPNIDRWRALARRYEVGEMLSADDIDELNSAVEQLSYDVDFLNMPRLNPNTTYDELLDWGLDFIEGITDIDIERDLFDHLGGEAVVSVGDLDFDEIEQDPLSHAVDAVVMLSYREEKATDLADTMDEVTDLIHSNLSGFIEIDSVSIGADTDATFFNVHRDLVETNYAPGYVLNESYLSMGTTERALETTVALQNGGDYSLAISREYARAIDHLPAQRQALVYANLERITRQMEPAAVDLTADEFEILEKGLGSVAIAAYSPHCLGPTRDGSCQLPGESDVSRITAVLTLFPE